MQLLPGTLQPKAFESSECNPKKFKLRGHKLSLTCTCVDSKDRFVYTASKDGSIIKWCLQTKKILMKIKSVSRKEYESNKNIQEKHHFRHINCLAISSDDRFLASGGWDKKIRIWSADNLEWVHTFSLHKSEITALSFRKGHPTLYSGSADRSVMIWTLEEDDNRCYVESLYGHESPITSMDATRRERVLTAGGRDQTIRIWKIVEQAQTVFQSKHESVDIVRYVDDKTFVSGGEDGTISVWTTMKRTPVFSLPNAHEPKIHNFKDNPTNYGIEPKELDYWITALATFHMKEDSQKHVNKKRKIEDDDDINYTRDPNSFDDDEASSDDDEKEEASNGSKNANGILALVASGSCDCSVKVWKLVKKGSVYDLKLHQSFECPGFINDLKFTSDSNKLIVACGQEHKSGRWWKLKGVKNTIRVFDINKVS